MSRIAPPINLRMRLTDNGVKKNFVCSCFGYYPIHSFRVVLFDDVYAAASPDNMNTPLYR
jgi:hypothetical protein